MFRLPTRRTVAPAGTVWLGWALLRGWWGIVSVDEASAIAVGAAVHERSAHDVVDPRAWERRYRRRLIRLDAMSAVLACALAFQARFAGTATQYERVLYVAITLIFPLAWVTVVLLNRAYESRFLGMGSEEFRRVLSASLITIALLGTVSWAFRLELARGFVLIALPATALLSLIGRYGARHLLQADRMRGTSVQRVVVVGPPGAVMDLVGQMRRSQYHGMRVIGACTPSGDSDAAMQASAVPVLGELQDAVEVVRFTDADVLAVVPGPGLDGAVIRQLSWELESTQASLLVVPALIETIGPRVTIMPVCGMPFLYLDRPELAGVRRIAKHAFDRMLAVLILVLLSPFFIMLAVLIKFDSRGPILFRQVRVGLRGAPFMMLKFRTMVPGAERSRTDLVDRDEGNGVLFKMREDPRVTRVGRLLRRYSLDELPQLLNVAVGQMSLVGPRPALPAEVALYEGSMNRRLLVKPGITGLWQINGRSDLDWNESVRLDLRYVDNWSFAFDLAILWKTTAAVLRGSGAY